MFGEGREGGRRGLGSSGGIASLGGVGACLILGGWGFLGLGRCGRRLLS